MVTRTLSVAESRAFALNMANKFGVACGGDQGSTWSYFLWYPGGSVNSEGWQAQIYSRNVSGSYDLVPKSGWKEVALSGNQINVRVYMWNEANTLRRWHGNNTVTNPNDLPREHIGTGPFIDPGIDTVICPCTRFFVPGWVDSSKIAVYLNGVATSTVSIAALTAYVPSIPRAYIRHTYLNDLMNHRQPFGPTSRAK